MEREVCRAMPRQGSLLPFPAVTASIRGRPAPLRTPRRAAGPPFATPTSDVDLSGPMPNTELPRVLVVDDNHDNANIMRQYLEALHGYSVAVAYDGTDALRLFAEEPPDVVLLDVMMPGLDGWAVCRAMKSDPEVGKRVRVIMVTALDDLTDKRTALQTGADDFLEKPLDLARLAAAVRRNLATLSTPAA